MPGNIFSRIGRALSIFGVSNPEDIRQIEERKALRNRPRPEADKPPNSSSQPSIHPKSTDILPPS